MIIFIYFSLFAHDVISEYDLIADIFNKEKAEGTFVLYDYHNDKHIVFNPERAVKRYYPASTFKIFNSLIALSVKAISGVDDVFYKYSGEKLYLESWQRDSNLRYAIKVSNVNAYQKLAKMVGYVNMRNGVEKLSYGNMDIGGSDGIDSFWLKGPLKISALEQADIIMKLALLELPFEESFQRQVIDIITLEKNKNYMFYGKTGWAAENIETPVGWFVGFIEKDGNKYSFAFNMDLPSSSMLEKREIIVKKVLRNLDLMVN